MYNTQILHVTPRPLAAVRGKAEAHNIGPKLIELLSEVWEFVWASGLGHTGQNVAVYPCEDGETPDLTDTKIPLEAGVQVLSVFEGQGRVICSATPEGRAATVTHFGPYDRLSDAHGAVREWCHENGHELAGTSWEVYGHWTDNPDELRTDVFYLLRETELRQTEQEPPY